VGDELQKRRERLLKQGIVNIGRNAEELPDLAVLESNLQRLRIALVCECLDLRIKYRDSGNPERHNEVLAVLDFLFAFPAKHHARNDLLRDSIQMKHTEQVYGIPRKVISGGQSGADMGGLLAARELGIKTGGFAPHGWLTESGPKETLLRSFGLIECQEKGYPARTRRNIETSDGTLLIGRFQAGGSKLTYELAGELKKPLFTATSDEDIEEFRNWLKQHQIQTLNVAGNRESQTPGIAEFTRSFLLSALR
jgi:hypothetical protein